MIIPSFGWRRTGELVRGSLEPLQSSFPLLIRMAVCALDPQPYLSGGYSVGCIELDVPAPTRVGTCPVLVLYPSLDDASAGVQPAWLTPTQSEQLGRAQLSQPRVGWASGALAPLHSV